MPETTRFAPSPTGYLHLGHAYSALYAKNASHGGEFILRIEDIDPMRCKAEFTHAIFEDLEWIGLDWTKPVRHQSAHMNDYISALEKLKERGLVYPCFCTRKEIMAQAQRAAHAPHASDGTVIYPGTCREMSSSYRAAQLAEKRSANWRLDIGKCMREVGALSWHDKRRGTIKALPNYFGDVVLARKDMPTSYHLSVTVDDHLQGVTLVTRGDDLFSSTHVHRLIQAVLGFESPRYDHHPLMIDESGRRFAKRENAKTLRALRSEGKTPSDILELLVLNVS